MRTVIPWRAWSSCLQASSTSRRDDQSQKAKHKVNAKNENEDDSKRMVSKGRGKESGGQS
eukprot:750737-Hanusia_phi.AAC.4